MKRDISPVDSGAERSFESDRRAGALQVLLEIREKLLAQLSEEILSKREVLLEACGQDALLSYEFQEIEDRFGARLSTLNSLVENLEYRQPQVQHRIETFRTTLEGVREELDKRLGASEHWDLADMTVIPLGRDDRDRDDTDDRDDKKGGDVFVVLVLAADEFPE